MPIKQSATYCDSSLAADSSWALRGCELASIGFSLALYHLTPAGIALAPIGKTIVPKEMAWAARRQDAERGVIAGRRSA